jgi:4a-hydroxytetrahydrobiopterin dehydratase
VKTEAAGWLGEVGGILFAAAWLWALITSFNFYRAVASRSSYSFENFPAPPKLDVAAPEIISGLHTIPDWKRQGQIISRTFVFKDFPAAMAFTNAVASLAEQAQHHPDMDVRWNKVTLALTTHNAGGLTEKDFALARQCDALAASN